MAGKEKKTAKPAAKKRNRTSVSGKLMRTIIPMVGIAIVLIIVIVITQSGSIITSLSNQALTEDAESEAMDISQEIQVFEGQCDAMLDIAIDAGITDPDELAAVLAKSATINEHATSGIYGTFDDETYFDASGWVPDADYVPTERSWYTEGQAHETFLPGEPYVDAETGSVVVSFSRKFTLKNGTKGVAAIDYFLDGIVERVSAMKPLGSGGAMLLSSNYVLSYFKADDNGQKIADVDDSYLQSIAKLAAGETSGVQEVKSYDGNTYDVALNKIEGTDWTLVSSVNKKSVLAKLNQFQILCYILMVVMIIVIGFVLWKLIDKLVTKPVRALTDNIVKITDGDFTVDIPAGGDDEIGVMNNSMKKFVEEMHGTLGDIHSVTNDLSQEAENSKTASSSLNSQAKEQSDSMGQIKETMEGMAQAVQELAENATSLAQEVSDLMDQGNQTNDTVTALVNKAESGQEAMGKVESGMANVKGAMTEMNDVVTEVGDSAKQINEITTMIASIAEQTNLLSLNASIEAARAGEAGKGFAVVASEIGKLANDSSQSSTQIADILKQVTAKIEELSDKSTANMAMIEESTEAVANAGDTFKEIFEDLDTTGATVKDMIDRVGKVDGIASSVAAISEEQSASTEEVTVSIDNLAESAAKVADESHGVDTSAETVSGSASTIKDFVNRFKL